MSENHSFFWLTYSYLSLLSLLCLLFSSLPPTYYSFFPPFFHSFLSICTLWSLGYNKCHTASFTLTGGQLQSQTTRRWLVRGHPSYLGHHCFHCGFPIHCIPWFFPLFHVAYFILFLSVGFLLLMRSPCLSPYTSLLPHISFIFTCFSVSYTLLAFKVLVSLLSIFVWRVYSAPVGRRWG